VRGAGAGGTLLAGAGAPGCTSVRSPERPVYAYLHGTSSTPPWISVQDGKTALDNARENGHGDVTSLLEAAARTG